jgi:homoserine kinase
MYCSVAAPGSSANLGPGFDCLALALDRWTRVDARTTDGDEIIDAGSPDLLGGSNLVIEAMRTAEKQLGLKLPGCEITVASDIPIARGMGSSAAAIVAGIKLAAILGGMPDVPDADVIDIGGAMEGHADNVSASVLGGVTVSAPAGDRFVSELLTSSIPWTPVLFVPDLAAFTSNARAVLPTHIPMADVVANVSRSSLLTVALRTGNDEHLRIGMEDRLHQPYRAEIFPHLKPVIAAAVEAGAAGAALSGAGPTVLALSRPQYVEDVRLAMAEAAAACNVPGRNLSVAMVSRGCHRL